MPAGKSPPLKVIGIYSLSGDWAAYSRFLRQEIDDRDASKFPDELKEFLRQHGRGDEIRPLTAEDRQEWEEYLRSYMDDVAIIEVLVTDPDGAFKVVDFVQPDPSLPDMLQYRVVFAIHAWKPDLPLRSSYGELALPKIEPLPERLWRLAPYEVPT